MKNIYLFILLALAHVSMAQIDAELSNDLQTVLNNSVVNAGNNGVSAYLIMPDGETWNGTAGIGQGNLPITDLTVFHGASTTKLNVATLVMLLVEEDLIELDASWNQYLSLDADFDPLITVRHLLNHTSGIRDYLETASSGADITLDYTQFFLPQHILENVVNDDPLFTVGTSFQYSNSNYVLAAMIVESVTGNTIQTELRNRIWTPLGMNHTYFGGYESYTESSAGVYWNFGSGLTNYSDVPHVSMLSYAYGAGNIVTCPTDLGLFLHGLLDGQLITPESLEQMLTFEPESFNTWTAGYGLGIHHFGQDENVIGHDGYYTNMTDMFHDMDCGYTLVTMTNTQTSWFGIFTSMYTILEEYCNTSNQLEISTKYNLTIYPNPTHNQIHISCEENINQLEITDITGKIYYNSNPMDKNLTLEIEEGGLYFIKIVVQSETMIKKVIVN